MAHQYIIGYSVAQKVGWE